MCVLAGKNEANEAELGCEIRKTTVCVAPFGLMMGIIFCLLSGRTISRWGWRMDDKTGAYIVFPDEDETQAYPHPGLELGKTRK